MDFLEKVKLKPSCQAGEDNEKICTIIRSREIAHT